MKNDNDFICGYCGKHYKNHKNFEKHFCAKMQRNEEIKTIHGRAAYQYYCSWLEKQQRLKPSLKSFISSRYYLPFIRFTRFVDRTGLPKPLRFIDLMIERKIYPNLWTFDIVYTIYIKYLKANIAPIEHVQISLETIFKFSNNFKCKPNEVLSKLKINQIINLIKNQKLSPWILINSQYFARELKLLTNEQHKIIENLINPTIWKMNFMKYPKELQIVKMIVKKLKL